MSGIKEENLPRIRELIFELNKIAEIRKETADELWILAKHRELDRLQACVDKLWSLEDSAEVSRIELMQLLNTP